MIRALLLGILALIACERPSPSPTEAKPADSDAGASDTAQPDTPEQPEITDPKLLAIAARLPEDWTGTGLLDARETVPHGAPEWAKTAAEVVDVDGKRFLRASGLADRIRNPALARNAAAARARASLAEWLGSPRLVGSEVVDQWAVPGGPAVALARIEVPTDWQPGRPLPEPDTGDGAPMPGDDQPQQDPGPEAPLPSSEQ